MLNRRSLLRSSALGGVGLALAGCATVQGTIGQTLDTDLATAVKYARSIAGGVAAVLPYLPSVGLSAEMQSLIQAASAGVTQVATDLAGVLTEASAQPLVEKLATYVGVVVSALSTLAGLPPVVQTILAALKVAVPAILSVLNIVGVTAPRLSDVYEAFAVLDQYGVR